MNTDRLLLLGDMAVKALQPVELRLLGLSIGREAAKSFKEPMARVVLVPGAVLLVHSLEQLLFFLYMALRQWFILGEDNFQLTDLVDLKVLRLPVVSSAL
jgi:hypothetical protein